MEPPAAQGRTPAASTMSFLLDTDICSSLLKASALAHRFTQHLGHLHISVVTLAELYTWALRKKAPRRRLRAYRICSKILSFLT